MKTLVRNNLDFVNDSITIPEPVLKYIKCFTPPELLAISSSVDKNVLNALNAGDIETAKELLGSGDSEENILNLVNKKLYRERDDLMKLLETKKAELIVKSSEKKQVKTKYKNLKKLVKSKGDSYVKKDEEPSLEDLKKLVELASSKEKALEKSVDKNTQRLNDTLSKIKGIEERVSGSKDKQCPICSCTVSNPCLTRCCQNVFCLECLGTALSHSKNKECPLCRTPTDINKVHLIDSEQKKNQVEKNEDDLPMKMDALIKYISENKHKRILVFSEYGNTFKDTMNRFAENNISYSLINGSGYRIASIIDKFKSGHFQVLLLNAQNFGAGLNLQFAG